MGETIDIKTAEDQCDPITRNKDISKLYAYDGTTLLDPEEVAIPCGLIAKSVFNDTFSLSAFENFQSVITIDDSDIAWKSDVDYKFKNQDREDWDSVQWHDITDQHFIVWMRTAGLPSFRKLYGAIQNGLNADTYYLRIQNNYDVAAFGGSKKFVLSTTNLLGG